MPFSAPGETATFIGDKTITGSLTVTGGINYAGGWADVTAYGAVGDGVADDTAAIQAAIDSWPNGGPVFLPAGVYRITSTLTLKKLTRLQGVGYNRYFEDDDFDSTRIDAQGIGNTIALQCANGSRHVVICDLGIHGPGGDTTTSIAIFGAYSAEVRIDNVGIRSFGKHIEFDYTQGIVITRVFTTGAAQSGLYCYQCSAVYVSGAHFANCIGGNIRLGGGTQSVVLDLPILDEGGPGLPGAGNLFIEAAHNVVFRCPLVYLSRDGYSIRIGPTCSNITLSECVITPFSGDRVGLGIIKIDAGATGVRLLNVTTVPNGSPADIEDDGTDTVWINVNGRTKHPVVATAVLPGAGELEDGRIVIEDAGAGAHNLIFYAGGERFRIDGGSPVPVGFPMGPLAVTLAPGALAVAPDSGLLTGLVSYWKLDEASGTRNDSHGSNHLTDINTVTSAAGKIGNEAVFTKVNSERLTVASNASLQTGDIDFTIAGWFHGLDGTAVGTLLAKWGTDKEYAVTWTYDHYNFQVTSGGSPPSLVEATGSGASGGYDFVVCWHDATANTLNVQVNNGTPSTLAHSLGVYVGTSAVELGHQDGNYTNIALDEIGFWKRILSPTERTNLYAGGDGVSYPFVGVP